MKNSFLIKTVFAFITIILMTGNIYGTLWEVAIRAVNSYDDPVSVTVRIYTWNSTSRDIELYDSGSTATEWLSMGSADSVNGVFDISDSNTTNAILGPLPAANIYFIKMGTDYFKLSRTSGAYGDLEFFYRNGNFSLVSNSSGYSVYGPYTWTEYDITLKNDFGSDRVSVSGNILFNSATLSNVGYSGTTLEREARTFPHSVSGQDNQYISSYYRKWRTWNDDTETISKTLSVLKDYDTE